MARATTRYRVRSRPVTLTRSTSGSPTLFHAASAPSGSPSRYSEVARIRDASGSVASYRSAWRAFRAASRHSALSAWMPAISRHGAADPGHSAAATWGSLQIAGSGQPHALVDHGGTGCSGLLLRTVRPRHGGRRAFARRGVRRRHG